MDPYDLDFSTNLHNSASPDFQCGETSLNRPSCKSQAPTTFSSSIDGRYQLNRASQFDIEYIDPVMLESRNPTAMNDFIYDYPLPAIQNNQTELPTFHPERSTAMDFEQQQQNFQTQQGGPEVTIPNALHTSANDYTSFDWPEGHRGGLATLDHIANEPIGSPDSRQEGQFG